MPSHVSAPNQGKQRTQVPGLKPATPVTDTGGLWQAAETVDFITPLAPRRTSLRSGRTQRYHVPEMRKIDGTAPVLPR